MAITNEPQVQVINAVATKKELSLHLFKYYSDQFKHAFDSCMIFYNEESSSRYLKEKNDKAIEYGLMRI